MRKLRARTGYFPVWITSALLLSASTAFSQPAATPANERAQDITIASKSLGSDAKVRVLLPSDYASSQARYSVLYLLHGLYGDYTNWDKLTELESYTRALPVIVVMPDAGNSFYVNSATIPGNKFEDFLIDDIVPDIERKYRVLSDRQHRAIAGLSVGGYGALKYAIKHPDMFAIAGSFSGALNAPLDLAKQEPAFAPYLDAAFGRADSPARAQNDVFRLITKLDPQSAPFFYLDWGTSDPYFIPTNRTFTALLRQQKFAYEYHEVPGTHDWRYWNNRLKVFIALLQSRGFFQQGAGTPAQTSQFACTPRFSIAPPWLGADAAYSIPLPDGRDVWIFGDTLYGDHRVVVGDIPQMVRNSIGVSTCRDGKFDIRYLIRQGPDGKPADFFPSQQRGTWYWALDGVYYNQELWVTALCVRDAPRRARTDLGFALCGTDLARVSGLDRDPQQWEVSISPLVPAGTDSYPSAATVIDGAYLYIFSLVDFGAYPMALVRIPLSALSAPRKNLQYLAADGAWKPGFDPKHAEAVMDRGASEMSVRYHPELRKWVAVMMDRDFTSGRVLFRTADRLEGPWSEVQMIYRVPEMQQGSPRYDPDNFCYAGKEHPEFEQPGSLVFTYVCNTLDVPKLATHLDIYYPQAVEMPMPARYNFGTAEGEKEWLSDSEATPNEAFGSSTLIVRDQGVAGSNPVSPTNVFQ
jgi:putative tributyrin esterase